MEEIKNRQKIREYCVTSLAHLIKRIPDFKEWLAAFITIFFSFKSRIRTQTYDQLLRDVTHEQSI